uniref:Uncharacterized protein n=1 Tax=Eutreptiella gymnastica TaxID=73025 RepID=A0A7S1IPL1_9EUGL
MLHWVTLHQGLRRPARHCVGHNTLLIHTDVLPMCPISPVGGSRSDAKSTKACPKHQRSPWIDCCPWWAAEEMWAPRAAEEMWAPRAAEEMWASLSSAGAVWAVGAVEVVEAPQLELNAFCP